MKNLITTISIIFVLQLVVGCQKDRSKINTIMYGKVTDVETGNPIEGARLYYVVERGDSNTYYLCSSDAQGHYDFNQQLEFHDYGSAYSSYDYSFYMEKENYKTYSETDVRIGSIVERNFTMTKQ